MIDYEKEWPYFDGTEMIKKFNLLLGPLVILAIEIFVYFLILFLIEIFNYCNICSQEQIAVSAFLILF